MKWLKAIIAIALLVVGILLLLKKPQQTNNEQYVIDSLTHSIDSLQDCINNAKHKVDTIYMCKTIVKHIYEKKEDSIWNQSADDDWNYYSNFLSSRFQSDSTSAKTN